MPSSDACDTLTLSPSWGDAQLTTNLFGATPYAYCLLAFPGAPASAYADTTSSTAPDHDPAPIGFALYFFNFSTWTGKPGLYVSTFVLTFLWQGGDAQGRLLREVLMSMAWTIYLPAAS